MQTRPPENRNGRAASGKERTISEFPDLELAELEVVIEHLDDISG